MPRRMRGRKKRSSRYHLIHTEDHVQKERNMESANKSITNDNEIGKERGCEDQRIETLNGEK